MKLVWEGPTYKAGFAFTRPIAISTTEGAKYGETFQDWLDNSYFKTRAGEQAPWDMGGRVRVTLEIIEGTKSCEE